MNSFNSKNIIEDSKNLFKKAFTIVELSIVVIGISLLVTLFLSGKSVVEAAQVDGIIAESTYYRNAVNDFKQKFGYLPGDVPYAKASAFYDNTSNFSSACYGTNTTLGNNFWDTVREVDIAFLHMKREGFIDKNISFTDTRQDELGTMNYSNLCQYPLVEIRSQKNNRPESDAAPGNGWTLFGELQIPTTGNLNGKKYKFYNVYRIGSEAFNYQKSGTIWGGRRDSTTGARMINVENMPMSLIKAKTHAAIDEKIDTPNTPFSGRYIVDAQCRFQVGSTFPYSSDETCLKAACVDLDAGKFKYKGQDKSSFCTGNFVDTGDDELTEGTTDVNLY